MDMSAKEFPVGHANRKRDVDEVLGHMKRKAVEKAVQAELQLLRQTNQHLAAKDFPEVDEFLAHFSPGVGRWRRPVLLIYGATNLGKSLLAASVLRRVGVQLGLEGKFAEVTVEQDSHLDFSDFSLEEHGGVLLDGVGDVLLLKSWRETLQGRPKECKGARSATMKFAYAFTLARRAVVVTMDMSAANLHLLASDHWLSDRRNVLQLHLTQKAWREHEQVHQEAVAEVPTPAALLNSWSVNEVVGFLKGRDLEGPAATFFNNGVAGRDFAGLTLEQLTADLRLSNLAARKVLEARDTFAG